MFSLINFLIQNSLREVTRREFNPEHVFYSESGSVYNSIKQHRWFAAVENNIIKLEPQGSSVYSDVDWEPQRGKSAFELLLQEPKAKALIEEIIGERVYVMIVPEGFDPYRYEYERLSKILF